MAKKIKKKKTASKEITLRTEPRIVANDPKHSIFMFFGPPGTGKSTLVNNFGKVFFFSTDRGTRYLMSVAEEVNHWDEFDKELTKLEKYHKKHGSLPYDFICLDHVDDITDMAQHFICEKMDVESLTDAGHGRGWDLYKRLLRNTIHRLKRLGVGIVFICHEDMKTVKISGLEVDRIMPLMQKSAWKIIVPLADIVGYISLHSFKVKGKRVEKVGMQTKASKNIYAKDRTNRIPKTVGDGLIELLEESNADNFLSTFKDEEKPRKKKKKKKKSNNK